MADYPALQPALHIEVVIGDGMPIGTTSKGPSVTVVPMVGGTLKSAPGFEPVIDAEFVGVGNDYIHTDTDGKFMRLNAHGVVKNKSDGALIYLNYTGIVTVTPAVTAILSKSPNAKTTPWGNVFNHMTFETGIEKYKTLENNLFIGSGRFRFEEGKQIVEYKMSKAIRG